jgi:hypothetical protein
MIPVAWAYLGNACILPRYGLHSTHGSVAGPLHRAPRMPPLDLSPLTEGRVPLTKRSSRFTEPLEQPVEIRFPDPADADRVLCYGRCFTPNDVLNAQISLWQRGIDLDTVTVGPPVLTKTVSQTGLPKPGAKA